MFLHRWVDGKSTEHVFTSFMWMKPRCHPQPRRTSKESLLIDGGKKSRKLCLNEWDQFFPWSWRLLMEWPAFNKLLKIRREPTVKGWSPPFCMSKAKTLMQLPCSVKGNLIANMHCEHRKLPRHIPKANITLDLFDRCYHFFRDKS